MNILVAENGFWHAREIGELIDHAAKIADLTDDRVGEAPERVVVFRDLVAIAPLKPLGGELDGCQRVLDLVGDTPRDVRPCRTTLVGELVGHIVEGQHRTILVANTLDRERPRAPLGAKLDAGFAGGPGEHVSKLVGRIAEARSREVLLGVAQQHGGGPVDELDALVIIDGDHACGHRTEDRLDEGTAELGKFVGIEQRARLLLDPRGHPVEGGRERGDLVLRRLRGNAGGEVALLDPTGSIDELADRATDAIRKLERRENGKCDDDDGAQE